MDGTPVYEGPAKPCICIPYAREESAEEEGSISLHEGGEGGEGGVEGQRHAEDSLPPQLIGEAPQDEGPRHHSQVDYQPCKVEGKRDERVERKDKTLETMQCSRESDAPFYAF